MLTAKVTYQDSKEWGCTVTDENGETLSYGMKYKEQSLCDFLDEVKKFTQIDALAEYLSPCCCHESGAYCYQHRTMRRKHA
jgi:hypothetical protein